MWQELLRALAIVLVLEGILPFLSPTSWKRYIAQVLIVPNRVLRLFGLGLMLAGVALLYIVS
jgi:uncharacterized protein YjeT (DUF2065 family)